MSAWRIRIFLMMAFCGAVLSASAQDRLLTERELDTLKIWFPVYKPDPSDGVDLPESLKFNQYETIAQLIDRVSKRETVRALRITADVVRKGNVERLSELKDLRVLYLEVDSATATSALWQAVSQLKRLQKLYVRQLNSDVAGRAFSDGLLSVFRKLPQLEQLDLTMRQADWEPTLLVLAGMPTLWKLSFSGNGDAIAIPAAIGNIRQLTSLTIRSGQGPVQIPASLGQLTRLKALSLDHLLLDQNRDWTFLSKLTELETLSLVGTYLRSLPDLRALQKLKSVDLHWNSQLSIGEESLSGLNALEQLDLSYCQLKQFPPAIIRLSGLKALKINGNPIGELPTELDLLKQLEILQAGSCRLRKLPETLGELTRLKTLELAGNQLDTLNFNLGKLSGLVSFLIHNNQLRFLPSSIGQLTKLDQLDLSNNRLTELPESMGILVGLNRLSVSSNHLTHVPTGFGKLTKLQKLDLMDNRLQQLPAGISKLRRLKHLSLSSNQLTQLPEELSEMDSLQSLDLAMNQLAVLPSAVFHFPFLQNLNLVGNKLTSLPSSLGKLANLTNLSLANNHLTSLPPELGKLTKLQSLQISDNPLEFLPETIVHCRELYSISARNTKLKILPAGIVQLTKLQELDLSGNELTILPAALGNLSKLRSLRLGKTRLLALPESIGRLTHLTSLQVGEMQDISIAENTGLRQLPDSIVYCQELTELQLMNQTSLDGEDAFMKASKLRKLRNLTLFHSNVERLPEIDWKRFPVQQLSLMQNRLAELPVEMLDSPNLQRIALYENLLPQPLNTNFNSKDALRLAFSEAGLLALDKIAKPNRGIANSYLQMAFQKAGQRNWTEAFANFEKAIDYASDTMRVMLYAQRADMHVFRQEYAEAIADYDQSISLADRLTKGVSSQQPFQKQQFEQPAVLALRGRANAKARLGQVDAARADIEQAVQRLGGITGNPELKGNLLIEQGRYLTLKNKLTEANQSYRKALEEYEKMPYANTGIKLTVVELHLIVGQPDQARTALQKIDKRELQGGNAILEKYLESSIQVLKGEKPVAAILDDLKTYVTSHSERIMGWSFELYENWLSRADVPAEKRTVLQQMTQLVKERVPKMD